MRLARTINGAVAGAAAAGVWAAQQPLDRRAFDFPYDDVELLGKLVTRGRAWPLAGAAIHVANGALFGAAYAQVRPFLPGPPVARGVVAALAENFATWPLTSLVHRHHPAAGEFPRLVDQPRALAQATWRHALFGAVLGLVEGRLNAERIEEPPLPAVSSNGHGDLEAAATAATAPA